MDVRVHIIVEGLVQGVGFRWFVYSKAKELGVCGWVQNLHNGNVEIEAEGDRSKVEEFLKDVQIGPRSAQVKHLRVQWLDSISASKNFEIR